jgi:hypothetical protein
MSKQQTNSGFAHLIIIVVLAVALVGSIGYIVWNNFANNQSETANNSGTNNDNNSNSNSNSNTSTAVTYKTFTDSTYNISFQYPSNWTVGEPRFSQSDMPYWNRDIDVSNENGELMARLSLGVSGLGGTCGPDANTTFTVLDSTDSLITASKQVAATFVVYQNTQGRYLGYYGLQDSYTTVGDYSICLFYDVFTSNIKFDDDQDYGLISFGNGVTTNTNTSAKQFDTLDAARTYIQSDEYKAIKKMLLSFSY